MDLLRDTEPRRIGKGIDRVTIYGEDWYTHRPTFGRVVACLLGFHRPVMLGYKSDLDLRGTERCTCGAMRGGWSRWWSKDRGWRRFVVRKWRTGVSSTETPGGGT